MTTHFDTGQRLVAKQDMPIFLSRTMDNVVHQPVEYALTEGTVVEVVQPRDDGVWVKLLSRIADFPVYFLVREIDKDKFNDMPPTDYALS